MHVATNRPVRFFARTDRGELYNMLETPIQPLLVVGNEGLLKELSGKVRKRKKKKAAAIESEKSSRGRRPAEG